MLLERPDSEPTTVSVQFLSDLVPLRRFDFKYQGWRFQSTLISACASYLTPLHRGCLVFMAAAEPDFAFTMYYGYAALPPAGGTAALIVFGGIVEQVLCQSHRSYLFGCEMHRVLQQCVSQSG